MNDEHLTRAELPPNIIVIEDEADIREIITVILEGDGHSVIQSQDTQKAMELIARHPSLDLVLCDITMPGKDGLWFLAEYRTKYQPAVPVLMVTAHSEQARILEALRLGCFDYITKPFDTADLKQRVAHGIELGKRIKSTYAELPDEISVKYKKRDKMMQLFRSANNERVKKKTKKIA